MELSTLCFDLDGTLLDSNKLIRPITLSALLELKKKGFTIVLASGRSIDEIEEYSKECNLSQSDYIIAKDGIYVYNGQGELLYTGEKLSYKDVNFIINASGDERAVVVTSEKTYRIDIPQKVVKKRIKSFLNGKKQDIPLIPLSKLPENTAFEKVQVRKEPTIYDKYTVHPSEAPERWDVLSKNVNKYKALKVLSEIMKIEMNKILYFGDAGNDLEVFLNLKNTVAMENSPIFIKEKAKFITKSSDEDGVGIFLREQLLKR